MKGRGSLFQALTQFRMSASRAWTDRWSDRWSRSEVTLAKNRSTWLIQEEYVGVKCMWNRGWASSHLVTVCQRRANLDPFLPMADSSDRRNTGDVMVGDGTGWSADPGGDQLGRRCVGELSPGAGGGGESE